MPTQPDPILDPRPMTAWRRVTQTFFKGLLAVLPLAATVYILVWLASILESPMRHVIENWLTFEVDGKTYTYYRPGMGFVIGLLVIFIIGLLINAWLVRELLSASESLLSRVPVAKTVLTSVRELTGFFSGGDKRKLGQVVLVDWGSTPGGKVVGFLTRENTKGLPGAFGADNVVVYIPFSYALGGVTTIVPRSAVTLVDMPMEEAMRFALTAGIKAEDAAGKSEDKGAPGPKMEPKNVAT